MIMPGRKYTIGSVYRYGFNGQEKVEEINESVTTAMFWEYDSRIGRRWNIDPKTNISISPYNCFAGNPIFLSDEKGDSTSGGGDPPVRIGASIGLRIGLGSSGGNINLTGSVGIRVGSTNNNIIGFVSGSAYGGNQLGTTASGGRVQFDLSAGVYGSVGTGSGTARNFYTLNYNTISPFKNTSDLSISFGQMVTKNSAINANGDGPGAQAQGILGLRLGNNFMLSTNNDSKLAPSFAGLIGKPLNLKGTDAGWTGGITLNVAGVEVGYQNFSGYRAPKSSGNPHWGEKGYKYPQTDYQKSLNKASTYLQVSNARAEYFGAAWFQNFIHNKISKESTYDYNYQNKITASGGVQR